MASDLEQRVEVLEAFVAKLYKSDRYTFEKTLQILDGRNVQVGNGTGTILATEATQRLGFFGATPIAQPGAPTFQTLGGVDNDGNARAAINQIINKLSANSGGLGLWA